MRDDRMTLVYLRQPAAGVVELVISIDGKCTIRELTFEQVRAFNLQTAQAIASWPIRG